MEDDYDPETYSFASGQDFVGNSHLYRETTTAKIPDSLFIQERLSPILQFPLRPIELPTFYNEQIGLSYPSDPNDALYQLSCFKPFIIDLPPSSNSSCNTSSWNSSQRKRQFIFGYREIFLKRQRLYFLRQIAGLKPLDDVDSESSPFCKDFDRLSLFSVARGGADQNPNPNEEEDTNKKKKIKRTNSKISRNSSKNKIGANAGEPQQQERKDSQNSNPGNNPNNKQGKLKKWFKGLKGKKDGQGQDEEGQGQVQGKKGKKNVAVTVSKIVKEKEEGGKKGKKAKGPKGMDDEDGTSVKSKGKKKRPKTPKEPKEGHLAVEADDNPDPTETLVDPLAENQAHQHTHSHHHHHQHADQPSSEHPAEAADEEKKGNDDAVQGHELTVDDTAKTETTITINPTVIEVPEVEQKFMREKVPEIEEEEGALIVETADATGDTGVLDLDNEDVFVPITPNITEVEEKEDEWLELSPTNSIEAIQRAEAKTLKKEYESWMQTKISFESQNFVGAMKCYLVSSKWTGRSPFYTKYDYNDYVIDFMVDRRKEFIYFTTSIILWLIFVLIVQAMIDVAFLSGDDEYTTKEKEEFFKYVIPSIFIIGQLAVTALWSVLVLLNYGLRMAHYANTWSVALTEMEINAAKGIANNTVMNHVFFFLYLIVIVVAFATETPKNVRGSMGILTILLVRNAIPRAADDKGGGNVHILIYQIIGVVLHLYIMYCSRIIYNQIQIFAIVLRNASEMWNLKFALRFGQIPTGTSGYLKHLKIRQTLVKIWLHHRLLTALCVQLGEIFVMPIMVIFISNLGIVVYAMTKLFESAYSTGEKRETYISTRQRFNHSVKYLPTEIEDVSTILFVLIYLILDFLVLAYFLASAGQAFRDGFEFVRRKGLILCNTSHERRLVQSLQWSFSATNATEVNLLGFFAVNWETMLSFLSIALLLWSLIIQLQQEAKGAIVIYTPNCSQEPRTKRPSPDIDGFCRKKIWVPESELDARVAYIEAKIKNTATDLDLRDRRRRRRRRRSIDIESHIIALSFERSRRLVNENVFTSHHLQSSMKGNKTQGYYYGGDCLKPLIFKSQSSSYTPDTHDLYNRFTWRSYYDHFHEKCFSSFLNETFIVPKLYGEGKRLWRGRSAVDCGLFPFPFPSYFGNDCSGEQTRIIDNHKQNEAESFLLLDYDDCGWKKTKVDDIAFASDKNSNNLKIGKVPILLNNGQVIHCWNIFSALKRCHRIKELDIGEICPYSRNKTILDDPNQLLKSFSHLKLEKTAQLEPGKPTMQMKTQNIEHLLRRG